MKEPEYYNQNGLSPLTAFKKGLLSENETLGFIKGNIIKYVVRAGVKTSDAENDIEKAITYLNHLKELLNNSNDEEVDSGTLITYKLREGTDYIVDCIHCSKGLLKKFDLENISDVQELLSILNNHEVLKNINYENADLTFLENKLKNTENKYHKLEQDLYNIQEKYMKGFDFKSLRIFFCLSVNCLVPLASYTCAIIASLKVYNLPITIFVRANTLNNT